MKKLLAFFLAFALLFSLAACNDESESDSKKRDKVTFDELVVVDNDECKITITKLDLKNNNGPVLKTEVENKTEDKTLGFHLDSSSVNGIQCGAYFYQSVEAGKDTTGTIVISDVELQKHDIGNYTDIELAFRVNDDNDWEAAPLVEKTVHVYPYGEEKATKYVREPQKNDTVLVDNDYVSIIATGYEEEGEFHSLNVFMVNKAETVLEINADNVSVNGFMSNPYLWNRVYAGKSAFDTITWQDSDFGSVDIGDFTDIEMTLFVRDSTSMGSDPYSKDTVHYYPYGEDKAANITYQVKPSDQILVDNEYVQIIATGCEEQEIAQVVNLIAINKSNKNVNINASNTSVNGLMLETNYWCTLSAGKSAFGWMDWSKSEFEDLGLGDFTDIETTFTVTDSDDWYADTLAQETIRYYPEGESKATTFNYTVQSSDTVLVDNEYVSIIITGHEKDDWGDYELSLFYTNKVDQDISINARDITVNGISLDPYYSEELPASKCGFLPMQWSSYTLEENNITDISEIVLTLEIFADYGWYTTNLVNETYTLVF